MFFFRTKNKKKASHHTSVKAKQQSLSAVVVSDVGCRRNNNEDNFILGQQINADYSDSCEFFIDSYKDQWFFAGVFDGMGGGEKGELAAQIAAQAFKNATAQISNTSSETDVDLVLRQAFLDANNKILEMQDSHIYGTTGTIVAIHPNSYKIYHLGDSRAYLLRDAKLRPLTKDQTLAQMKIDIGLYMPNDPLAETEKHKLTEYIGKDTTRMHLRPVESDWIATQRSDLLLLCSDGLYDMCPDEEILKILNSESCIVKKAEALVESALTNGGIDNVTCVLLAFSEGS